MARGASSYKHDKPRRLMYTEWWVEEVGEFDEEGADYPLLIIIVGMLRLAGEQILGIHQLLL